MTIERRLLGLSKAVGDGTYDLIGAAAALAVGRTRVTPKTMDLYAPAVTVTTVVDCEAAQDGLTWTADPSIAFFDGLFYAAFDGNNAGGTVEGATGQRIFMKTSADGVTWSAAYKPFHDAAHASNPAAATGTDFQPNLVVVDGQLWCAWYNGAAGFLSKLTASGQKWTNNRFEFSGRDITLSPTVTGGATGGRSLTATFDGYTDWVPFSPSQPIVLSDGVLAMPMTMMSLAGVDAATDVTAPAFFRQVKANVGFLCSADRATWTMTEPINNGLDSTGVVNSPGTNWEVNFSEALNGDLVAYSRNNRTAVADRDALLVAFSRNRVSFTPSKQADLMVPVSRPSVSKASAERWLLAHNNYPHSDSATPATFSLTGRQNGTLFVSRRGLDDYVPGVSFAADTLNQIYPQVCIHGGKVYVVFAEDRNNRRSLRLATLSTAPTNDAIAYVHPRRYSEFLGGGPTLTAGPPPAYVFHGAQQATAASALASTTDFSLAAWLTPISITKTVLYDSRSTSIFGPVLTTLGLSFSSVNLDHGVTLTGNAPLFLSVSFDATLGRARFSVDAGSGIVTVDRYVASLTVASLPTAGDTVVVNGTTFTFRASVSVATDVLIGASAAATALNLATVIAANGFQAAQGPTTGGQVYVATTSATTAPVLTGSTHVTVDSTVPVNGAAPRIGLKSLAASGLVGYSGAIYSLREFNRTLSAAEQAFLHDTLATSVGLAAAGGGSDPGAATLLFDTAATTGTFPDLLTAAAAASVVTQSGRQMLQLAGEACAAVELPFEVTAVSIPFKLDRVPSGSEKFVIATLGSTYDPFRIYIDGADPGVIIINDTAATVPIPDPTRWNTLEITVAAGRVLCGGLSRSFVGPSRLHLGQTVAQGLLASDHLTLFDVTLGSVADGRLAEPARLRPDVIETVVSSWKFTGNPPFTGNPAFTGTPTFSKIPANLAAVLDLPASPMTVGKYYTTPFDKATGANAITLNTVYYIPFSMGRACTLDRIGLYVVGAAGASGVIRLGLYADDGTGLPGALLVDGGTVDATAATTAREATISKAVARGLLHVAVVGQGWGAGAAPTLNVGQATSPIVGSATLASAVQGFARVNVQTGVTGALPATATPADPGSGGGIGNRDILVALRAAA